jgi:hypothetical protein
MDPQTTRGMRLSPEQWAKLAEIARAEHRSLNGQLRFMVDRHIAEHERRRLRAVEKAEEAAA